MSQPRRAFTWLPLAADGTPGTYVFQNGAVLTSMAIDPSGLELYGPQGNLVNQYNLQPNGSAVAFAGWGLGATTAQGVAVRPNALTLYTAILGPDSVSYLAISPGTGVTPPFTQIGVGGSSAPYIPVINPQGTVLYTMNQSTPTQLSCFTLAANGVAAACATPVININASPSVATDIVIESSGQFLYVALALANQIQSYRINPVTGALTATPGSPFATGAFQPFSLRTINN